MEISRRSDGRTIVRNILSLSPTLLITDAEMDRLKADYPTLVGDETVEMLLLARQVRVGLFGKDSDSTTATEKILNRAYGLPKAEIDVSSKLVQVEPLSEVEVVDISTKLLKGY